MPVTGGAGAVSFTLPFGVARRRALEQDSGVEDHRFGADVTESPLEPLFRSWVLEERAVLDLHGVPVLVRETAQETGESAEVGRPKDGGSWIERAWARCPRGSIAARKARSGSSTSARRRSWVIGFGSLRMNRKSGVVCSAHDFTVPGVGVA